MESFEEMAKRFSEKATQYDGDAEDRLSSKYSKVAPEPKIDWEGMYKHSETECESLRAEIAVLRDRVYKSDRAAALEFSFVHAKQITVSETLAEAEKILEWLNKDQKQA